MANNNHPDISVTDTFAAVGVISHRDALSLSKDIYFKIKKR